MRAEHRRRGRAGAAGRARCGARRRGRRTFTATTSVPSCSSAWCTCATDAAASGASSKSANSALDRRPELALDRCGGCARAGSAGTSSSRRRNSSARNAGEQAGRRRDDLAELDERRAELGEAAAQRDGERPRSLALRRQHDAAVAPGHDDEPVAGQHHTISSRRRRVGGRQAAEIDRGRRRVADVVHRGTHRLPLLRAGAVPRRGTARVRRPGSGSRMSDAAMRTSHSASRLRVALGQRPGLLRPHEAGVTRSATWRTTSGR